MIREALGDDVLYYLGKSYGTYIGALYADLFPDRVGRLVLDGAVDPSLTSVEFGLGQATGIERALSAYLADCVAQADCPLGSTETEAHETVAGLIDVIADDPLPTDDADRPLTETLAIYGIILPLYVPPEQGYEFLTQALSEALAGSGETLLFLADTYLLRNPDGTYNGNQNEAISAVHCVDRPSLDDVEQIETTADDFAEVSPIFGPFLAWGELSCAQWPVEPVAEPAPVTASGADPILVVGTTGDLATPYEWAEGLAEQLESGVLLTYEGFGHTAYFSGSDCIDSAVDTYLLDGDLPGEDELTCS
jgi:pimeloyl-ACP methyl ester carboxylesterase